MPYIISGIIIPILFIIYNIACYFKRKVSFLVGDEDITVIDDKFFSIQLWLSILNAVFISLIIYFEYKHESVIDLMYIVITYIGMNSLIKYIAVSKKYVERKGRKRV